MDSELLCPILIIPKRCSLLGSLENVLLDLKIQTSGNKSINKVINKLIYSGLCKIRIVDYYDVKIQQEIVPVGQELPEIYINDVDDLPVIIADSSCSLSSFNQSEEVWIDPSRSPYVYNDYDTSQEASHYLIHQEMHTKRITIEQHNTYITHNVYNHNETVHYSTTEEFEHMKFRKVQKCETNQTLENFEDDKFDCGVFLSHPPEEIIHEKEINHREERKFIGSNCDNNALKQLMSTNIQSACKQRKTILFLGEHSRCGQTVQQVAYTDPLLACPREAARARDTAMEPDFEIGHEVVNGDTEAEPSSNQKKYQCAKCHEMFDQLSLLKEHMVDHTGPRLRRSRRSAEDGISFLCPDCGKNLKTREKFEIHCLGHGNPDLECNRCGKVFASKFSLKVHKKIHSRKHFCTFCPRTYSTLDELRQHMSRVHSAFMCEKCVFVASTHEELNTHIIETHGSYSNTESETETADSLVEGEGSASGSDNTAQLPEYSDWKLQDAFYDDSQGEVARYEQVVAESPETEQDEQMSQVDDVIAKVMKNQAFSAKKNKRNNKKYTKVCDVCLKTFDRVSDLKRHLIEHVVRSTLAKNPVSKDGTLNIQCEICRTETFITIDKYKAHLRDHAKLTLYQCTFCNKSFSDSSNFSKHKKIHGVTFFQCDLCHRKFTSKKMIELHMEHHNKNPPMICFYCNKEFHFESMLNKHIKSAHSRQTVNFKCRFCKSCFRAYRDKWDHEWMVHNVRKMIVDCMVCGQKFRKYADLKRHCTKKHKVDILPASMLLRTRKRK